MKNLLILAAVFASSFASADTYGLGLGGGVFYPSSSLVRDLFGSSWVSYGISPASAESSVGGKIAYDLQIFARSRGGNRMFLISPSVGWSQGFAKNSRGAVPYLAARIGPAYTDFRIFGDTERGLIMNTNFEAGVTVGERLRVFGRYDAFTKRGGVDFSGFSFGASWLFASF
ncbi:MAG: hypothetical protein IT206_10475 [Fimbriimonadaceae bacterium]|nr:hypothetical protein [Fimbriimonadaceae bacterium]